MIVNIIKIISFFKEFKIVISSVLWLCRQSLSGWRLVINDLHLLDILLLLLLFLVIRLLILPSKCDIVNVVVL